MSTLAVPHSFWILAISLICGGALWKGGPSEKLGAAIMYGAWLATFFARNDGDRHSLQYGAFLIDAVMFAALVILALRSDRFWPMFAAGFELLSVVTHVTRLADAKIGPWVYFTATHLWGYLTIGALGLGTVTYWLNNREQPEQQVGNQPW